MKFFHTALTVNNIEESTLFYKAVFNLTIKKATAHGAKIIWQPKKVLLLKELHLLLI